MKKNILSLFTMLLCFGFVLNAQNYYTVSVAQPAALSVDAGPNYTTCFYDSVQIGSVGAVSGGAPPYVISWFPTYGLSDPTISNPMALPDDTTTYTVSVTDANNCTSWSQMTVMIDPCAGLDKRGLVLDIAVYPNPVTEGVLTLSLNGNIHGQRLNIKLFSVYGQLMFEKEVTPSASTLIESIDVGVFAKGIYIMEIQNAQIKDFRKVLIQ